MIYHIRCNDLQDGIGKCCSIDHLLLAEVQSVGVHHLDVVASNEGLESTWKQVEVDGVV